MPQPIKKDHLIAAIVFVILLLFCYPKYAAAEPFIFGKMDPVFWLAIPVAVVFIFLKWRAGELPQVGGKKIIMEQPLTVWGEFRAMPEFMIMTPGHDRYSIEAVSKGDTGDWIFMADWEGDKYVVIMDGRVGTTYRHPTVMRWRDVNVYFPSLERMINITCPAENVSLASLLASMDEDQKLEFLSRASSDQLSRLGQNEGVV